MLTYASVRAYIDKLLDEQKARTQITADKVLNELAAIAFANCDDYMSIEDNLVQFKNSKDLDKAKKAAVCSMKNTMTGPEVKLHDKVKALELIARHLGMFDQQKQGTNDDGVKVIIDV